MTASPIYAERLAAQLLAGPPAKRAAEVAERLLAVQAQDGRAVRLAVRARTRGLGASDVDRALADRELVITWLNRGTLHLVRAEDYPWLHALTTPAMATANLRRLDQEGVPPADAERAVEHVTRALADEGPLTRDQLSERVDAIGVRTERQALVHVLVRASILGLIVRGPMAGADQAYVLVRDWLGEQRPVDRGQALAELARRYLRGHGPADGRDLARWAGIGLRDARAGLGAIGGELEQRPGGTVELAPSPDRGANRGWHGGRAERATPGVDGGAPRLLGGFDPLLFGWVDRTPVVGRHAAAIVQGGIFKPIALVGGRAVATWAMPKGEVELAPLGRLRKAEREALAAEAEGVKRFLAA